MATTTARAATTPVRSLTSVLVRPLPASLPRAARVGVAASAVLGAVMIAASALIHLHLWRIGYRNIPRIGPSFAFQWASGFALAAVLLVYRRLLTVLAGVAFCLGSVAALVLSATVGFLGLHDGLDAPWAGWSLGTEIAGAVLLAGCASAYVLRR